MLRIANTNKVVNEINIDFLGEDQFRCIFVMIYGDDVFKLNYLEVPHKSYAFFQNVRTMELSSIKVSGRYKYDAYENMFKHVKNYCLQGLTPPIFYMFKNKWEFREFGEASHWFDIEV